jgi:hypothetical protein
MEENIEDRIKNIIKTKLKDNNFKDNLGDGNDEFVEKLFKIFPELKDDKKMASKNNVAIIGSNNDEEIVLEEFKIDDMIYYKDAYNGIWNTNAELIGTYHYTEGISVYNFFNKQYDLTLNFNNIIN